MAEKLPDIVAKCRKWYEEDRKHHENWSRKVDRWYKAYRGEYEDAREASAWRSNSHPRYLLQVVDTLASGLSDSNPNWKIRPRPKSSDPGTIERLKEGSGQVSDLLRYQREIDGMVLKQHQHRLQGLIAGLSVWKVYWEYQEVVETKIRPLYGEYGEQVGVEEYEERLPVRDDPCVVVVDVRDFFWPESATSIENAPRLHHRTYMTYEQMKRKGYKNIEQFEDKEATESGDQTSSREQESHQSDRTKGRIEVIEHWIEGGKRVVTVAEGSVLLSDRSNPFKHGRYPFVACAPIPELFRVPGISVVEIVEDLQKAVWKFQRQREDNLEILNNSIIMHPEGGLQSMEDRVFAPGEQWLIEAADNAPTALELPTYPADISLQAEQMLKADIQAIPGASPALMGQTEGVEQTATEISLTSNLAQRRLAKMKQQFTVADVKVGELWIELNRQFLKEPRWVAVVGKDGDEGWSLIHPEIWDAGDFAIQVEQMDESLIRQERQAEAQSRLQVILTALPAAAAIGIPINLKAYIDDILEASGVQDKERYWSAAPQPAGMLQGGQPPQGPPGAGAPAPGADQTAPQAFDQSSPSNAFSQSPQAMLSRLLSQGGGPSNA